MCRATTTSISMMPHRLAATEHLATPPANAPSSNPPNTNRVAHIGPCKPHPHPSPPPAPTSKSTAPMPQPRHPKLRNAKATASVPEFSKTNKACDLLTRLFKHNGSASYQTKTWRGDH